MSSSNPPTVVIDDTDVHYNTSRDASQAVAPSKAVIDSVNAAKSTPWNNSLAVITSPVSVWYNVTGYSRIAVYGALIPPTDLGFTAWANYTINGNYTAANITTSTHIVTDFPLFTSIQLDPNQQYNLTADIWASPDAPYLFDYLLAFSPPDPTPISTSSTASSTSTGTPTATPSSSGDTIDIPHPLIIIGALAGACALLLAMWLVTLCCWCRSRGSKHTASEEEPMGPEPPFAPRPSVNKSATLVSAKAARRAESFLEPSLQTSSTIAPTPALSLLPERTPTPVNVAPGPPPRPATTYVPEHGQFAGQTHHRSATLPTQHYFVAPAPNAMMHEASMREGIHHQRPISPQHMLPHVASMPRLGTPLGMSTPTALQLPTPFEHPPAGQILRPESPLHNPYDDLYGHLDAPAPIASGSRTGTGTSTGTRSRSPATTPTPAPAPAPSGSPIPTSTPTVAPSALPVSAGGPSAPAPTTTAPASAPEATSAAPAPAPAPKDKWGANEYPPEKKKKEVRLEPPARAQASASEAAPSGSPEREDFADSPPAYSS